MRRFLSFPTLLALLLVALGAGGCVTSSQTIPLSKAVATRGQDLATAALAAYDAIDEAATLDATNQMFTKSVFLPAGAALPAVQRQDFSAQLNQRRKAFRALKNAYGQLQTLAGANVSGEASTATGGVVDALNGLAGAPDISSQTKSVLTTVVQQITSIRQQRSLRQHHGDLAKLTNALRTLWNEDEPEWKQALNGFTAIYVSEVKNFPASVFDDELVQEAVDQPFIKSVASRLYQIKLITAAQEHQALAEGKLRAVSKGFDGLVAAHMELEKDKPSAADVITAANQILDATEEK